MAVYKQKGSKNWWYQFIWDGKRIRESTKQTVSVWPSRWKPRTKRRSQKAR